MIDTAAAQLGAQLNADTIAEEAGAAELFQLQQLWKDYGTVLAHFGGAVPANSVPVASGADIGAVATPGTEQRLVH